MTHPEERFDTPQGPCRDVQDGDGEVAIREALSDMANGDRGMPFEEFDREFRKRHNLLGQP